MPINWNNFQTIFEETGLSELVTNDILSKLPVPWLAVEWNVEMSVHPQGISNAIKAKIILRMMGNEGQSILAMLYASYRSNGNTLAVMYDEPVRYFSQNDVWVREVTMSEKYSTEYNTEEDG